MFYSGGRGWGIVSERKNVGLESKGILIKATKRKFQVIE